MSKVAVLDNGLLSIAQPDSSAEKKQTSFTEPPGIRIFILFNLPGHGNTKQQHNKAAN